MEILWSNKPKVLLTSEFFHLHVNSWKCEICFTDFLIGTWDIKARFDERFARVHELCLYCVLAWSANSLHGENHQVGCYWMLVVTGSMHNIYWVPWKKLWWLSGEFCLWTCVLLNLKLWAGEKEILVLLKIVGSTAGRWREWAHLELVWYLLLLLFPPRFTASINPV